MGLNGILISFGIAASCIIVLAILVSRDKAKKLKREREENERALLEIKEKIRQALERGEISHSDRELLFHKLENDKQPLSIIGIYLASIIALRKKFDGLTNKYGAEIANKMINHQYWVGMTAEQVIECKGQPTKIEKEVLKTKTKETYIYGNKSSGDYFVVESGTVVKFVDR